MTVKDLIRLLNDCNPNANVYVSEVNADTMTELVCILGNEEDIVVLEGQETFKEDTDVHS